MSSRILLVDDDKLLREVVGEYLSSRGYEVDLAEDGANALAKRKGNKYQLVLIDHILQEMNGLELMKKIHAGDPGAVCLIMTGYQNLEAVQKSVVEGVSDYIIKPFRLLELLHLVKKYV